MNEHPPCAMGRRHFLEHEEGELLVPPTFDPTPEEKKRLS